MSVYRLTATWGVCAASRPGLTADELAQRWGYTGEFYLATRVGAIRDLGPGFDVIPDEGDVHAVILLPREPDRVHARDPLWLELQSAFVDSPQRNPNYSERG